MNLLVRFFFVLQLFVATVACSQEPSRPNIVVILCDDLGYGDLECYGHPHIRTPYLNQLATTGVRLTNCYSAAPVCSPSRVGLLTGRSPNRAGVYDWIPAAGKTRPDARDQVHMRREEKTIASLLSKSGYATCMSGKWHCNSKFNSDAQPQPGDFGFDHWFGTQNNAAPSHENPRNYVRNGSDVGPLEGFSCQLAANEAIAWMQQHCQDSPDQPFFVYLAFHEPHEPVASPPELVASYESVASEEDEAQYFANVENMDRAVGRVIKALEELDKRKDTLIYFSSDNGPETLDRYKSANRSWGRASPLRGMKLWTTDAGFRVAGILSWPAVLSSGQTSDQIVSSLDLLPTFCELAGITPGNHRLDGASFVPLLHGGKVRRDKPLIWCYYNSINEHRVAMRDGEWKVLAKLNQGSFPKLQNVHDGNRAKVLQAYLTDFEIYRVSQDIGEAKNLVASAPESSMLIAKLQSHYAELCENSHVWQRPSAPSQP